MREGPWVSVHKYGFFFVAKARSFKIICKSKRRLLWWPASATTTQFLSAGHLTEEVIILTTITYQTFPERTKGRTPQPTLRVWSEARDVCQQQGPTAFTGLTLLRHRNQTLPVYVHPVYHWCATVGPFSVRPASSAAAPWPVIVFLSPGIYTSLPRFTENPLYSTRWSRICAGALNRTIVCMKFGHLT